MHRGGKLSALSWKRTLGAYEPKSPREQEKQPIDKAIDLNEPTNTWNKSLAPDLKKNIVDSRLLEPAAQSLMIIKAKTVTIKAGVLIDSGAEVNHISLEFCRRNKIGTKEENTAAIMANGYYETLRTTVTPPIANIEGYTEEMRQLANTQTYDLVLRKNCDTNTRRYYTAIPIKFVSRTKWKFSRSLPLNLGTRDSYPSTWLRNASSKNKHSLQ